MGTSYTETYYLTEISFTYKKNIYTPSLFKCGTGLKIKAGHWTMSALSGQILMEYTVVSSVGLAKIYSKLLNGSYVLIPIYICFDAKTATT